MLKCDDAKTEVTDVTQGHIDVRVLILIQKKRPLTILFIIGVIIIVVFNSHSNSPIAIRRSKLRH